MKTAQRNLALLFLLATLLAILTGLYLRATSLVSISASPERAVLREIIRLDAELNRDLLLLRVGLLRHYDSINASMSAMIQQLATLRAVDVGANELEHQIALLDQTITRTEDGVEHYKSDIAVMRNSLMYLTLLADHRFAGSAVGEAAALRDLLARLDVALLHYLPNPRSSTREHAQEILRAMAVRNWSPALRAEADELVVHGSAVFDRAARVDATLRALRADAPGERAQRAEHAYQERARLAAEQGRGYWAAVLSVALLLAVTVAANALRLRNATRELARSRNHLRALFESAPDAIVSVDGDQRILSVNPAAEALFGYTAHEAVGQPVDTLIPERFQVAHRNHVHNFAAEPMSTRRVGTRRCVIGLRKDGTEVALESALSKFEFEGSTVFIAMARDIGERQRMEAALREFEARFRAAFEQAAVGMALVGPDGRWLRVNQKLCDIVGYSYEELLALTFQDITLPDDLEADLAYVHQMLDGKIATYTLEKRYIRKNGTTVWVNLTVALVHMTTGAPDYFIAVIEDIDARKRVEQEREQLAALVEASSEIIGTVTLDGHITYLNPAGCEKLGVDPATVTGRTIADFVTPAFLSKVENDILPAVFRDGYRSGEFRLRHCVTGVEIPVQQYVFTINDPRTKKPVLLASISHDITERKRAEAHIRQLNAELEQRVQARTAQLEKANKDLDAFASSVSHDLRAPLRAIDGFSQQLLDEYGSALDPAATSYLTRVRAAAQRMSQLIDDLLQFARTTRVELSSCDMNLSALARDATARLAQSEPTRQVEIHIAESLRARGDPRLLAIVLDNLLGNAWKYTSKTPRPRIEFAATREADQVVFFVRDNGAGFDMQYADRLFRMFQRLHRLDEFPGTGVGLATVANIIHRHGGRVWAESTPNQGATFYFTLPERTG